VKKPLAALSPIAGVVVLLLLSCAEDNIDRRAWTERGRTVLEPFKEELKTALVEGLEAGPEETIDVCRVLAPEIAEEASSNGLKIGRTSHRLRNPENAPKPWMEPLLEKYLKTPDMSEPEVVRLEGGGIGYAEPIYVKPMCLACHGKTITTGVASRLDEHYPTDRARGFEEGDFRGLFWVEFTDTE
jgi:hypothetical protein